MSETKKGVNLVPGLIVQLRNHVKGVWLQKMISLQSLEHPGPQNKRKELFISVCKANGNPTQQAVIRFGITGFWDSNRKMKVYDFLP